MCRIIIQGFELIYLPDVCNLTKFSIFYKIDIMSLLRKYFVRNRKQFCFCFIFHVLIWALILLYHISCSNVGIVFMVFSPGTSRLRST